MNTQDILEAVREYCDHLDGVEKHLAEIHQLKEQVGDIIVRKGFDGTQLQINNRHAAGAFVRLWALLERLPAGAPEENPFEPADLEKARQAEQLRYGLESIDDVLAKPENQSPGIRAALLKERAKPRNSHDLRVLDLVEELQQSLRNSPPDEFGAWRMPGDIVDSLKQLLQALRTQPYVEHVHYQALKAFADEIRERAAKVEKLYPPKESRPDGVLSLMLEVDKLVTLAKAGPGNPPRRP